MVKLWKHTKFSENECPSIIYYNVFAIFQAYLATNLVTSEKENYKNAFREYVLYLLPALAADASLQILWKRSCTLFETGVYISTDMA